MKRRNKSGVSLYIHIPYCIKKCNYCDFVSFKFNKNKLESYVNCLNKEIELFYKLFSCSKLSISTIYFGGGTPSLLLPKDLELIVKTIKKYFDLRELSEFTIEANPETVEYKKFLLYKKIGVNRVSIGAQSFNDRTLKVLGRVHNSERIYKAFEIARNAGFENINIDLMFGLPGENLHDTLFSLRKAVALSPEHISFYSLMIEEGTDFFIKKEELDLPDEEEVFLEYKKGIKFLESQGYRQYEISNFAKRNFESSHNIQYWKNLPYIGFGVSAASYLQRRRIKNSSNPYEYCKKVKNGVLPVKFSEHLVGKHARAEHVIMNLRMLKGIDKKLYYTRFGNFIETDFGEIIEKLKKQKLLKENRNYISLTKKGLYIANVVFEEFLP